MTKFASLFIKCFLGKVGRSKKQFTYKVISNNQEYFFNTKHEAEEFCKRLQDCQIFNQQEIHWAFPLEKTIRQSSWVKI